MIGNKQKEIIGGSEKLKRGGEGGVYLIYIDL